MVLAGEYADGLRSNPDLNFGKISAEVSSKGYQSLLSALQPISSHVLTREIRIFTHTFLDLSRSDRAPQTMRFFTTLSERISHMI